ncbi:helix-turn-helix domain-containing protein, partial [Saccharothrix coeruleofusca]|uniref:helix-turn-helix domain-containing protein n=1 Tax=Saccharothrix coeruleofusca TaxID=33919 RepID=UPI0035713688
MGRPPLLGLYRQVQLTLVLLRQNLSQTVAADWFGAGQPTVSRVFRRITPLIEQALCLHTPPLPAALTGRVVLVDSHVDPDRQPGRAQAQLQRQAPQGRSGRAGTGHPRRRPARRGRPGGGTHPRPTG